LFPAVAGYRAHPETRATTFVFLGYAALLQQLSAARFVETSSDRRIALTSKGLSFGRFVTAGRTLFGIASAN
jgi:hypothetical protein